MKLTEKN